MDQSDDGLSRWASSSGRISRFEKKVWKNGKSGWLYHSSKLELYAEGSQTKTGDLENNFRVRSDADSSRNRNSGFPTTWLLTILNEVLVPTCLSKPCVGALLNLMTKSFLLMCSPRLEPSRDPAEDTTPQVLNVSRKRLNGFSGKYWSSCWRWKNSSPFKKVRISMFLAAEQTSCFEVFSDFNFAPRFFESSLTL